MKNVIPKPRWWHPIIQKVAATPFGAWLLATNLHKIDRPFLRLSNDRVSLTGILAGLPVVILTTTGAKTGKERRMPLSAVFDEDKVILIASFLGNPNHPGWYHNLKANPQVRVKVDGIEKTYTAREAEGGERDRYWAEAVALYQGYEKYREKAAHRRIPVMVLTPKE